MKIIDEIEQFYKDCGLPQIHDKNIPAFSYDNLIDFTEQFVSHLEGIKVKEITNEQINDDLFKIIYSCLKPHNTGNICGVSVLQGKLIEYFRSLLSEGKEPEKTTNKIVITDAQERLLSHHVGVAILDAKVGIKTQTDEFKRLIGSIIGSLKYHLPYVFSLSEPLSVKESKKPLSEPDGWIMAGMFTKEKPDSVQFTHPTPVYFSPNTEQIRTNKEVNGGEELKKQYGYLIHDINGAVSIIKQNTLRLSEYFKENATVLEENKINNSYCYVALEYLKSSQNSINDSVDLFYKELQKFLTTPSTEKKEGSKDESI